MEPLCHRDTFLTIFIFTASVVVSISGVVFPRGRLTIFRMGQTVVRVEFQFLSRRRLVARCALRIL